MTSFQEYLTQGHAWLFIPTAVVLGALHGLEPGHSKTVMAAFIISIRGTVRQAVLLGLSATLSHTAIIWVLAFVGLHYAGRFNVEETEPYFAVATGIMVMAMAGWMFWRIRREQNSLPRADAHAHHEAAHGPHGGTLLKLDNGDVEIAVFEDGVPPHFELHFRDGLEKPVAPPAAESVSLTTLRPDGAKQTFAFVTRANFIASTTDIPEPHEFSVELRLPRAGGTQTLETQFTEEHHHGHDHSHAHAHSHGSGHDHSHGDDDAHAREHAADLAKRFANRQVTTWQIVLFGLTGGLLPCPSAFAVLLVCMQMKEFTLGFAIVLAFSLGLALTLVTVGTLAALSVKHATQRLAWLGPLTRKLPYASCCLLGAIGLLVAIQGARHFLH
ncbi:MAG: nickel/cobalt efflux transporter RcnA [Verrucomicrobiota bacterium]|jgi:nickel/cobalt exporter